MNVSEKLEELSNVNNLKNYKKIKEKILLDTQKLNDYMHKINNPEMYSNEINIDEINDFDVLMDMLNSFNDTISKYIKNNNFNNIEYFDELINVYINAASIINKCKSLLDQYKIDIQHLD